MNGAASMVRIGIVGGGIGGLALAQGLKQGGFSGTVFEQSTVASDTGGYRLHLTQQSLEALRRLLPARLSEAIESSAAPPETFGTLLSSIVTQRAALVLPCSRSTAS